MLDSELLEGDLLNDVCDDILDNLDDEELLQ
jgi:hypothetical protein